ncbi:MAG: DNA repair protein RadC [Anaerolineae bacterium]|jgi:DNA repair protein RadC|nr:DNA repair protein RadC [Anaerolineae bacterium]MDH7474195.1 DNA repair protein RadC [Anaerolineae bacterium]
MGDNRVEYLLIKDLPQDERPRERLERYGAQALSNAELLAIILRTGVQGESVLHLASRLLAKYNGLLGLARANFSELCTERGLGPAKATQLMAALELGRRLMIASPEERPVVRSPADAANLLMLEMAPLQQEHLRLLLLDTKNRVLSSPTVYIGSLNMSMLRVGEVFREAVRQNCAAIIVAHNHPSGDPTPSPEDIAVTERIVMAGQLLDVEVLDHLIIGQQRYVSLKERGLGFSADGRRRK